MRVLITGGTGFVGTYAVRALRETFGDEARLGVTFRDGQAYTQADGTEYFALDVTDKAAVLAVVERWQPTHVLHLAGIAAPGLAGLQPELAWRVHVFGALNLAEAILARVPDCVLLHVGSGLIYGQSAHSGLPLDEYALLAPLDEYGVTKAAADLAIGAWARKGLRSVRLRPFNHTGPGQSEDFVVPAFAMQIARIEAGLEAPVMQVGNLDAARDFLDVRDVARAYVLALAQADAIEAGEIFNIASGIAWRIGDILDQLLAASKADIQVVKDETRMRPSDLPKVVGNAEKARNELGWQPRHAFDTTLGDVLNYSRREVARL